MQLLALLVLVLLVIFAYCHAYKMGWICSKKENLGGSNGYMVTSGLMANNSMGLFKSPEGTVYSSTIGPVLF